jgi:anti-anti-sigma regulatory factor
MAGELEATLTELCEAGALEIEMDLRGVLFVDSSGPEAIANAKRLCANHHSAFFVVADEDQIRLLEQRGLLHEVPVRNARDLPAV